MFEFLRKISSMMTDKPLILFMIIIVIFLLIIIIVYTITTLISKFLTWLNSFRDYSNKKIELTRVDDGSEIVSFYSTYWGWQDNKFNYLKNRYPIGTLLEYGDNNYFVFDHYQVPALVETHDYRYKNSLFTRHFVYKTTPVSYIEINWTNRTFLETYIGDYINQGDDKTGEILLELSKLIKLNINQMIELKDVIRSLENNIVKNNDKKNIFKILKTGMEFGVAAHDIIEIVLNYWVKN